MDGMIIWKDALMGRVNWRYKAIYIVLLLLVVYGLAILIIRSHKTEIIMLNYGRGVTITNNPSTWLKDNGHHKILSVNGRYILWEACGYDGE